MTIRSIVALADGNDLHSVFSAAVNLTARLSGRLEVLHIKADPYDMIPIGIEGMTGQMIDEITDAAKKGIEDRRVRAKAEFDRTCATSGQSAHWKEVVGQPARMLSIAARFADLLVPGGLLLVGHSESFPASHPGFRSCGRTAYERLRA